ncbi:uncharacterized protein LOC130628703 [Hydractinia symbiolongicarpus]|uniref:uncharacterized protein LOC130628703 n=1 Tax=Hydractinia symbiolongicarpus TaxID=13093 RepID=UPI00254D39FA|nr:uncharacterized protein LOC130628703 [Hydractinia symbiolongicarpus]
MGYELLQKRPRRELFRSGVVPNCKKKKLLNEEVDEAVVNDNVDNVVNDELPCQSSSFFSPVSEHSYFSSSLTQQCEGCSYKKNVIDSLVSKINMLTSQVKTANRVKVFNTKKSVFTWRKIKTDQKMNFYTGIVSIAMFESVFQLLNPYLSKIRYWRGPKRANSYSKVKRTYSTPANKILTHRDEFLLTLMTLRLGLLNEDLADRFGISPTICSNTFTTLIQILSKILGNALVVWLPREAIRDNLPDAFIKTGHSKCRVIIDCTEVFIARPKSLPNQAATWSDYKHHNTIKFLIGISPAGFITFLSDCYGGRASDRYITKDSGFYELLERDNKVMADRGFQIREELLLKFCSLSVPPGARIKSQMTSTECKNTKEIANLQIHVERAINRVKFYRILKTVLPITMRQHADDIVKACAALCNLKPRLIR